MAQLYDQEFKTQEKAKYEHIRQAKEEALEDKRRAEDDRNAREHNQATEQSNNERTRGISREDENDKVVPNTENTDIIEEEWSSVSPEQAANYMSSKTVVSAGKWLDVIYKESSGNPYVENPIGCWGLLQINQSVHGKVSNLSPQEYLDKAVSIYQGSGGAAWETW